MDSDSITKPEAPTLATLIAAGKRPATDRETRKRSDLDRRRMDIITGKRRGRL